jgi:hypothetical protein
MISINTQLFRTSALYYDKNGRYEDGVYDSYEYHQYWEIEKDRIDNGYSVGGMRITGDHYWYLNYWPIMVTRDKEDKLYGEVFKNRKAGTRELAFPDFWDVDYHFFTEIDNAINNGQHFVWLKPRGVGASYKGSSRMGKNFF